MSDTDKENLFTLFYRGENKNIAPGNGIEGLDIVPFPCDYQLSGKMQLSIFSFMPQGFALELSEHYVYPLYLSASAASDRGRNVHLPQGGPP